MTVFKVAPWPLLFPYVFTFMEDKCLPAPKPLKGEQLCYDNDLNDYQQNK